jgi:indolepyruvate ferredoxin oxidoreductase, beta subunit
MKRDETTRIYIIGVGGQGSVTASRLLGEAAMAEGLPVTVSEVHGMSQRGGIVESAVLIGGAKSPLIGKGDADVLLSFEPLEAVRALPYCSQRTVAVVNTRSIVPFTVSLGQGKYPPLDELRARIEAGVGRAHFLAATELAEQAGNPMALNAVLLGALCGGILPIPDAVLERVVTETVPAKFREINRIAFALGKEAVTA